jgi:uncharacterized protein
MENRKKIENDLIIVIKPTSACNLKCKYCYTHPNASKKLMNEDILENSIKKSIEYCKRNNVQHLIFLWHGGEPLLAGNKFFTNAVKLQEKYRNGIKVGNSIQTNGTLITEEFLKFAKDYNWNIGISLDGPRHLHDLCRVDNAGEGTFDIIMKNVDLMRKYNFKIRAIAVLHKYSLKNLKELYTFFKKEEINVKIHPLVYAGRLTENYSLSISTDSYGDALCTLFDMWYNDLECKIDIQPLLQIIGNILTREPKECTFLESCQNKFLSISSDGGVYPCGRFDGIPSFIFGNIVRDTIEDIFNHPLRKLLKQRMSFLKECHRCNYKEICYGGCMNNAYNAGNIMEKDNYCNAYKKIFNHILKSIKDQIEILKKFKLYEGMEWTFM